MGDAAGQALPGERGPLPPPPAGARLTALALPARAKLNLTLAVTGVLADGRHSLATRFQAIDLHDLLEAEPAAQTSLEVVGQAPSGEENLVLRAVRALEVAVGRPLPLRLRLWKRVPSGAGLGGGSSDAAAALRAAAAIHGVRADLEAIAAGLGADVPFFLAGGAADGEGAGDRLRPAPAAEGWFAVAWPGFEISTAAVYAAHDRLGGDGVNHLERAALAVEPRLSEFRAALGAGWRMTGSGSAFFLPAATREEAEAAVGGRDGWTAIARPVGRWS